MAERLLRDPTGGRPFDGAPARSHQNRMFRESSLAHPHAPGEASPIHRVPWSAPLSPCTVDRHIDGSHAGDGLGHRRLRFAGFGASAPCGRNEPGINGFRHAPRGDGDARTAGRQDPLAQVALVRLSRRRTPEERRSASPLRQGLPRLGLRQRIKPQPPLPASASSAWTPAWPDPRAESFRSPFTTITCTRGSLRNAAVA